MEFLVHINIKWPSDVPQDELDRLVRDERERAAELGEQGVLVRMWRVPGTTRNVGIWRADDATRLHEVLSSLPFFPYMEISVEALAQHPVDPAGR